MSWLYSIIFAGLLFSSDSNLLVSNNADYKSSKLANITVVAVEEVERFEQTYPLNPNGRVSVSNLNGSITVETWDRNEVKLAYVKTADTREILEGIQVNITAREDYFAVETDYEATRSRINKSYRRLDVEYRLTVPRAAVLNEIETVNGSISIVNAENQTKASAVNGEVRATNLRGTANLSTVNGTVVADFDQLQAGSRISLNTVNGTVKLTIPSDANATIKADTVNGKISNDFGLPVRKGEYVGSDLYGRVGSGEVQIRLNSVNGGLAVNRKNDGKTINPATNLLNLKKENNEEDWNDEDTSKVKPPKPPNPPKPPKSPKPPIISSEVIDQSVLESLKAAEREIERIKPELGEKYFEEVQNQIKEALSNLNSKQNQEQIRQAQEKYREALARMGDIKWTYGSPIIERKTETFNVKGTPKITVDAKNCAVSVRGWDKPEVKYSLIKVSRSVQLPAENNPTIIVKNSDSTVEIKIPAEIKSLEENILEDGTKKRLEIFVPKKSNLRIVTNGEIRLEGISGEVDLQGVDETVNVRDADGKLSVRTDDGRIRVIGFRGVFEGKTGDGTMNLEGDFQQFNALSSNGTIVLTLPVNANAIFESNTEIETENVNLIRENAKTNIWRIGTGGTIYRMNVDKGIVIVRSADNVKINKQ